MNQYPSPPSDPSDRLTISRLMALTAGIGLGLALFLERKPVSSDVDWWRSVATAALIGCSLPGVLYTTQWRRSPRRHGIGSLLWLTLSLGALLMVPPVVAAALLRDEAMGSNSAGLCLYYTMPLASLWFTLAAVLTGRLRRRRLRQIAGWSEWFGWRLGLAWSVLGVWLLVDFYREAFFE